MSLFDDDFYKNSSRNAAPQRGFRGVVGVVLLAAGFGLLLTFLVFPYLVNRGYVQVDMSQNRSEKISAIAERLQPAIVTIFAYMDHENMDIEEMQDYSIGSGVVIQRNGDVVKIVTNYHVIVDSTAIEVMTNKGEKIKGKVIAKDKLSDLALIEVKSKLLTAIARYGDSDRLRVGETAIAIGNPLGLGDAPTITTGVISSVKRTVPISLDEDGTNEWEMDVIQTDAAVNEGNSGGALLNMRGELVGIISMKMYDIGVEGLAFALPINQVRPLIDQMMTDKKVKRPFIGVAVENLNEFVGTESLNLPKQVKKGLVVVASEGPAKKAGIKEEDVIVAFDDEPIEDPIDMRRYLYAEKKIGDSLRITFYRDGEKQSLRVVLAEFKEN